MGKIFATSDQHFGHENVIKFEKRPYTDTEEMDEFLILSWNEVVGPEDTVYILGDFSFRSWPETRAILEQLNGHKILVRGNHDGRWLKEAAGEASSFFDQIDNYLEISRRGTRIVMSHYPLACWRGDLKGAIHLYGHIHSNLHALPEGYNRTGSFHVGVDTNHYRPVDIDWILDIKEMAKEPEKYIPKDTFYCYGENGRCPFWDYADNRGEYNYGVCHYLNTTDFEQNERINNNDSGCWSHSDKTTAELFGEQFPHSLLWDECKECGINEEQNEEEIKGN